MTPLDRGHLDDETLSAHLDGALDLGDLAAADDHLERCAACRARRDALAGVAAQLRALPIDDLPAGDRRRLVERALAAVDPAAAGSGRASWWSAPAIPAIAALVLAVLVVTGLLAYDKPDDDAKGAAARDFAASSAELPAAIFAGDLGDLAEIDDPARLYDLRDAVARDPGRTEHSAGSSRASDGASEVLGDAAPPDRDSSAATPAHATTTASAPSLARGRPTPEVTQDLARCAASVEYSAGAPAEGGDGTETWAPSWQVVLTAVGTLEGQTALLVAFGRDDGGLQAFLLRPADCSILRFVSAPPDRSSPP